MAKTAVGLFEDLATADKVVARLLKPGFSRDEVKVVQRSDFDGTPGPGTDFLKIGGLPKEHAGGYWEAVRDVRVLVAVTSVSETADRAADVMDEGGAIAVGERTAHAVRVMAHASIRPLIRASILEGGRYNFSQFRKDLSESLISESLTRLALSSSGR